MSKDSPISVSAEQPDKVPSPRVYVRRQCERIDRLLSFDHSVARQTKADYDDAFHDAVHAVRNIYRYTDLLPGTSPAADRPVENSGEGKTCPHVSGKNRCDLLRGHAGDHMMQGFAVFGPRPVENSELRELRWFPLQDGPRIPWSVAKKAYEDYARRFGRSQSLERLAERAGFGVEEMNDHHPKWRDEVEEIPKLRAEISRLREKECRCHDSE